MFVDGETRRKLAGRPGTRLGYGRFVQTDPIGYGDGLNWYNYVGGDPVNKTDPLGLTAQWYSFCASTPGPSGQDGGDITITTTKCQDVYIDLTGDPEWARYSPGNDGLTGGGEATPGDYRKTAPPDKSCRNGPTFNIGGGYGGTVFAGIIGFSLNGSGVVSIPLSSLSNFSLKGTRITGSGSVTPLAGIGAFLGMGPNGILGGQSKAPQPGWSTTYSGVQQMGVGDGGGVELSAPSGRLNDDPIISAAAGPRGAIGAYYAQGVQISRNYTFTVFSC